MAVILQFDPNFRNRERKPERSVDEARYDMCVLWLKRGCFAVLVALAAFTCMFLLRFTVELSIYAWERGYGTIPCLFFAGIVGMYVFRDRTPKPVPFTPFLLVSHDEPPDDHKPAA